MESNTDYAAFRAAFRIEDLAAQLSGDLQTGLNACCECCDRHAASGKLALYWEGKDGRSASYTFADLQELSARFANFLRALDLVRWRACAISMGAARSGC